MGLAMNNIKVPKTKFKIDEHWVKAIINLHCVFDSNAEKVTAWLNTKNLNLGGVRPIDMLLLGRSKKLNDWIEAQLDGNIP